MFPSVPLRFPFGSPSVMRVKLTSHSVNNLTDLTFPSVPLRLSFGYASDSQLLHSQRIWRASSNHYAWQPIPLKGLGPHRRSPEKIPSVPLRLSQCILKPVCFRKLGLPMAAGGAGLPVQIHPSRCRFTLMAFLGNGPWPISELSGKNPFASASVIPMYFGADRFLIIWNGLPWADLPNPGHQKSS